MKYLSVNPLGLTIVADLVIVANSQAGMGLYKFSLPPKDTLFKFFSKR